jgi:hypothetical protein
MWRWSVLLLPLHDLMPNHNDHYNHNDYHNNDDYPNVTYDKPYCLFNNLNNY